MKVTAIIPAKSHSNRVSCKNRQLIGDETLVARKIRQLKACFAIDEVVVGSDADDILELATSMGATPLLRDSFHCDEAICPANEMIHGLASRVDGQVVLWAHCTNPFTTEKHYAAAIQDYLEKSSTHDSLMSVTKIQTHVWSDNYNPLNFTPLMDPHQLASTLPAYYAQNGAIFIQPRAQMVTNRYFYGQRPVFFEIPEWEALDINTPQDIALARSIVQILDAA